MKARKVALIHDWLFHMRGGEKVLEAIAELLPDAEIYTLFLDRKGLSPSLQAHPIKASFLDRIPGSHQFYQWMLPVLPWAIERFDLRGFDLVISSSHCVAKGVRVPQGIPHICYCHTPMRYTWYFEDEYFSHRPFPVKQMISALLGRLRRWDLKSSKSVTQFVANSRNVAEKVKHLYGKQALVIHPPLDTDRFRISSKKEDLYLIVSALVPYKRIDIAVDAFNALGRPLLIVGKGGEEDRLRKKAAPNIRFSGWASDEELGRLYGRARALIFPGEEDFGIVPLEAQACGTPVIAFGKGGALETILPDETGIFFQDQTSAGLQEAVSAFERRSAGFDPVRIRAHAESFSKTRFQKEFQELLDHIT